MRQADHSFRGVLPCLFVCLCVIVCDLETLTKRRPRPEWAFAQQTKGYVNGIETGFGLNPKASFW